MRNNEERDEQKLVVQYLEWKKIKFTAIPNSTHTNVYQRAINKSMGLRGGLPDLFMIIKDKLVFIEMKKKKNGKISDKQHDWIKALNKCDNCYATVCNGFEEAKETIDNHLNL
jgi:hypothetical protein